MIKRFKKFEAGEIADPRAFTLEETEGAYLSVAWEAPWYQNTRGDGPPTIVMDDEGNNVDLPLLMKAGEYARRGSPTGIQSESDTRICPTGLTSGRPML